MGNQEWLKHIVKIWNHTEVVQWDECAELHILDQGPNWQEADVTQEQEDVLETDNCTQIPVAFDGE